jgi:hypothetical protein
MTNPTSEGLGDGRVSSDIFSPDLLAPLALLLPPGTGPRRSRTLRAIPQNLSGSDALVKSLIWVSKPFYCFEFNLWRLLVGSAGVTMFTGSTVLYVRMCSIDGGADLSAPESARHGGCIVPLRLCEVSDPGQRMFEFETDQTSMKQR